jgi:histidinol-phosphate/aromatic aminotransferase/cobyric acid decarboxylase-like protein
MSLRNEWEFDYPAADVAKGARQKADYHQERVDWWTSERERVVAELRESGLEITEYEVTGGQRHDVQFDPKLTKRLSEAQSKIGSHARERDRYAMFARVLAAQDGRPLKLHPEDVDYFGLAA